MNYLDMINEINKIINAIESTGARIIRIPCDLDIDKNQTDECLAYRTVRSIANSEVNNVRWDVAIKLTTKSILLIADLIKYNELKHPEELKEFIENCCTIFNHWDNVYREAFNSIKNYHHNRKTKSIDDMNAEELREYIKTHKL